MNTTNVGKETCEQSTHFNFLFGKFTTLATVKITTTSSSTIEGTDGIL